MLANCVADVAAAVAAVAQENNIHPLTPILIINHPLSASSTYCNP